MITPKEEDIRIAQLYLSERLEAERSMTYNLEIVMREAANRMVSILYAANINPQECDYINLPLRVQWDINAVVDWLNETIEDYFQILAIPDKENKDRILPLILNRNYGMTFEERLSDYCRKYRNEILLLIGAGLYCSLKKEALAKSIGENLKRPYHNSELVEGIAAPISYGRGRTNSMFTAIGALTKFGIGKGWMLDRHLKAEDKGAEWFMTFRNSTYPCEICDDYASVLHPIEDPTPPLHLSCVCGTIYLDKNYQTIRL